ncbi:putative secreted protein (Por secretion system target) [Ulvibacter sp. MAR_2010_11]|uniref:T9SS type A sorting domain-containing protein n=1 Tax=Ulvibacter sp. MAR_2010_11 TaxID=1250229 RepID=UPI000C2BE5BF|nr:DUF4397 domain-containing protein [Ulvibacter sp. MAR_2010_11]PKA84510.1 putative secreted protein (Por secretion system target) [Ulvibacter sp. MAR_2010_11]
MKNVVQILAVALISATAFSQTARVNVIHNSADAAAEQVDVYLDAALALDNFTFRTESGFIDFPAEVEVIIGVAPPNSTSSGDAIASFPVTLMDGETYIVVADGIVSPTGYDPIQPFSLEVYAMGRETAAVATNTDVLVHHGSTDAPTVDVVETGAGAGTIVDNITYSEFQGYLELPTADYVLEVRDETGTVGVAAYEAPLATLNLDGAALVVLASGFLNPANNSNGPAFGLWVSTGAPGALLELPSAALGVNDFDITSFALYPNPTTEQLNVSVSGIELANYNVSITDMLGRTVLSNLTVTDNSVDVTALHGGIYQLSIMDGTTTIATKKFIKQ